MVSGTSWADASACDAELVEQARAGRQGAYDALFARHYARVYNFALRLDGNRDNAADIAQEAFVRAWRALGSMDDGQAFLRWIYRIALNLVRDRAKAARRKPWIPLFDLMRGRGESRDCDESVEFADTTADPLTLSIAAQREHALLLAVRQLPLPYREAVVLHHLVGMDVRAMAVVLQVPEGTVKSRLGRGRAQLRAALADWCGEELER